MSKRAGFGCGAGIREALARFAGLTGKPVLLADSAGQAGVLAGPAR